MNANVRKTLKYFSFGVAIAVGSAVLILGGFFAYLYFVSPGEATPVVDANGKEVVGSISEIEEIDLGGLKQWIITRAHSQDNPVLLFVHGGPGSPEFPFYRQYATDLEKSFTVVHWEQRGAGKSYSSELTEDDLKIEEFVTDIGELSVLLKKRYGKEKIYLFGHSWGSLISALAAHKFPEHFHAYIGMGQDVNLFDGDVVANDMLRVCAKELGDTNMLRDLEGFPNPPYTYEQEKIRIDWTIKCRGDVYYQGTNMFKELYISFMSLREYTLTDKFNWFLGAKLSMSIIEPEYTEMDLRVAAPGFDIPVYILQGVHDIQSPTPLAKAYFESLTAPKKQMFLFEESAHSPLFEEPEKTIKIIEQIARDTVN